jgi:aspartyl-tRNA(Asn)/glutamyl-tRNA(Gln) amidotransferase subunit C
MKVSEQEVDYVADLANLDLTREERSRMLKDLNSILDYIDTLNELDTTGVAPMAQVTAAAAIAQNAASFAYTHRRDQPQQSLAHDAAMQNAPDSDQEFFKVPKVIER